MLELEVSWGIVLLRCSLSCGVFGVVVGEICAHEDLTFCGDRAVVILCLKEKSLCRMIMWGPGRY